MSVVESAFEVLVGLDVVVDEAVVKPSREQTAEGIPGKHEVKVLEGGPT